MRILRAFFVVALAGCSPRTPPAERPPSPSAPIEVEAQPTSPPPATAPSATGKTCGGIAGVGCPEGAYCKYAPEAKCGAADQSGSCETIPDACTMEVDEVCGCDDKTYSNACHAARAQTSVLSKGACPEAPKPLGEGQVCGTRGVNANCAEGLYCQLQSDCGETDRGGTCKPIPKVCTKIYKPVCGCDGKTHPSACVAATNGVSVRSEGACAR